ncbi:type II toxin-antitoxin system PemK/MazF family toxin [Herbiconiux sp. KACC 21604]|uniref:type II toxin-antitoxin system PemK/MazF family toxin n=1 Tax=unclassified Herbiconiux TaxID=2618217 RepID=UPI00273A26F3|nr:type II toxin-antitoxin system PemK/MazF family toxin [Herbiconiux sp. SALV-R1]WPO85952.1 type II toxin-antitoxin system PemK/MazF family toxin [Herbiconiux sp. KACC 21604]
MSSSGRPVPLLRRGQIVIVALDPVVGSEASKTRPAVVVSNNAANQSAARTGRGVVAVVPVTSNTSRVFPFQVLLPASATGLSLDSKAQPEQLRSVSVERVGESVGWVPSELMGEVDDAIRLHLGL